MIKQKYHFDELKCHDCALEIVEKIEAYDYIKNVIIDYDTNDIIIESEKPMTMQEVSNIVKNVVETDHNTKHILFNRLQNIITDEYRFEDIDCANCAAKVEQALNKNENIVEARVNYVTKKVIIKHLNNVEVYNIASKIVCNTEPGAKLIKEEDFKKPEDNEEHEHHHEECCCGHEEHNTKKENHDIKVTKDELKDDIVITVYNVEDIDCANCALKIERTLNKNENIIDANVNFLGKKITIKHKKGVDTLKIVNKVLHAVEPDAYIVLDNENKVNNKKELIKKIVLIVGTVLFFIGVLIMHLGDEEITSRLGLDEPIINGALYKVLLYASFITSYACIAYDLIYKSIMGIVHGNVFNESFLMIVASLGALCLSIFGENEFFESCSVILLYKIGEYFQEKATNKSKDAIKELIEMKKDTVTLKDGTVKNVKEVKIGEIITIKVGEQVPLDGIIANGETNIDTKALTGESVPMYASKGEEVLSGSINLTKVVDIEVTKVDEESTMSKVLKLVEDATNQKSKSEEFITKFARIYTPTILILAVLIAIFELITGFGIPDGMSRVTGALNNMFSTLVISCPCALVISIPLGYFAGIGRYSHSGILVRGGNYIEALANAKTFVFDKTGTITKGNFKVNKIVCANGHSEEEVLELVAKAEQFSMHPIANSIQEAYNKAPQKIENAMAEEIGGAGLKVTIDNTNILVGNDKLMNMFNINFEKNNEVGTILYLAVNNEFYGSVVIRDEIRKESYQLFKFLNKKGYKSIMLTGDNEEVAKYVANEVGITEVKAKILPQEKYACLDKIINESKTKVVYVGDGINDTPSLKRADVGIAMGGIGSDSAKECADIVIMNDDISKVESAIDISKYTKKIVYQNIFFALFTKLLALILGASGILGSLAMLVALFADVGVCIIAILNVLRILKYKVKNK